MDFDIHDAIALTLSSNHGHMKSKTTMQKILYFHNVLIKEFSIPDYKPHFYGPYSADVSVALDDMAEFSFIDQKMFSGFYDTFEYNLTKSGDKYVEKTKKKHPDISNLVTYTVKTCRDVCDLKPGPLSIAAKTHYIRVQLKNNQMDVNPQKIFESAKCLGWDISENDVEKGMAISDKLGLVI